MNIEESINKIKEVIYMSDGTKVDYIDINHMDLGGEVSVDVFIEAIETLLTAYEKEKEKNNNVLGLIFEYGQTDGEHHKAWVIDQIVRIITENNYDKWVQHYEYDEETDEDYFWDVGIAP